MARRRINKRLSLILVGGLIVLIGFTWGWYEGRMRQRDPLPYLERGDELFQQQHYQQASTQYLRASTWAGRRGDTSTQAIALLKLSRVLPHLDIEYAVSQALGALNRAVSKDPTSIEVRKERLDLQYQVIRDSRGSWSLNAWQDLQQYADDLIELDPQNARAYYLGGLAMSNAADISRESNQNLLKNRQQALLYFQKASDYLPDSIEYCRTLARMHVSIAGLIYRMRTPLQKGDRQLVIDHWYKANHVTRQFLTSYPHSGAAMVLLADILNLPRALANSDIREQAAQESEATGTLTDQQLLEAYLEAFRQDSPRPVLTEVNAAIDRLIYGYIQAAQNLDTDHLAVELALANYWFRPDRRDLGKAIIALQKAVNYEKDDIAKLGIYLQIAKLCSQDAQRERSLKVCEEALELAKSMDLKSVRAPTLRAAIYGLHVFTAQTLLDLAGRVRGTDDDSVEQLNALLSRAEENLKDAKDIVDARTSAVETLIIRGRIAEIRRPRSRESIREAIRLYEEARNMMESAGLSNQPRYTQQYVNLQVSLARVYGQDGQPGAAEDTLTKGIETIRQLYRGKPPPTQPLVLLYLINLQLGNAHLVKAEENITALITQLSTDQNLSVQDKNNLLAEAFKRRVRQYQAQERSKEALQTARNIEKDFPNHRIWAISKQIQILGQESLPQAQIQAETEVLLQKWIELSPDSPIPLALLAELHLQNDQREKAIALLDDAVAQKPQLQEFLSHMRQIVAEPDPLKRQEIQERRIKEIDNPLQRQLRLYQLYRANISFYNKRARTYEQEQKPELAEEARQSALHNNELAIEALKQAYEIQPDQPAVYDSLFTYYLIQGDWQEAQKLVDRAKEKDWDGVAGLFFLGRLHNAKGEALRTQGETTAAAQEFQQALRTLEQAVRDRQTFYQAWIEKAQAERFLARYDASLQSARRAVKLNPNNVQAILALMEVTVVNWRKAAAADDLVTAERFAKQVYQLAQRALKLKPDDKRAKSFSLLYLDNYDYEEALKERLAMLEAAPANRANLQGIIQIYRRQYQTEQLEELLVGLIDQQPDSRDLVILLTNFYIQEKKYDQARQRILPARQRWPDRLEIATLLAETYRLTDQTQEAIACMQQFLDAAPEEEKWLAYRVLGTLYGQMGNQDQAVEAFRKAVNNVKQNQPQNHRVICDLARLMFSGAKQEALDIVLPLAQKDNQYAIQTMVTLCRYRGQQEEAVEWAQRGLDLAPESANSKITLAAALLDADKPAQAQQILQETIEQLKDNPEALASPYIMLANAHALQKNYDTAVRILEEAVASGINIPVVRFALADFYRFQGRFEQASQQYRTVLERYSGNMKAREELARSLFRQKNFRQAEDVLEEGRRVQPQEYRWTQQLSSLWSRRDDQPFEQRYSKALDFALEANTKSGNDLATILEVMSVLNVGSQYKRCVDFYETNVPEKHKGDYRILLSLARAKTGSWQRGRFPPPGTPPMATAELETLKNQAVSLLYKAFDKTGNDMQSYLEAVNGLVLVLGVDSVIASAQAKLNSDPEDHSARAFLATLLNRRGLQRLGNNQTDSAIADMNQAVELLQPLANNAQISPSLRLRAYYQLAFAYTSLHDYERAAEAYETLLKSWPKHIQVLNNLAYILTDVLDRPEDALVYIETAMRLEPQESNLLDTYGWTLFKAGQFNRAVLELRRSVAIRPSSINNYHLGVALKEVGETRLALLALREAAKLLENDPINEREIGGQLRTLVQEMESR